ncbi:hypothetical protein [Pseudochrobactrum sp. MP213Fo]|uniref:hypothetical protein n=1 Tax=Pseudochrobactrum sp. MP213Fo TaxID=3022250 RepID=UPI003BA1862E
MVTRVYIDGNEPRIITSKAGKEAGPALPDADKTFDSRWYSGGGIREVASETLNINQNFTVNFSETLNYIPKIWANPVKQFNGNQQLFGWHIEGVPEDFNPPNDGYVISNELGAYASFKAFNNRVEFGRITNRDWPWIGGKMICLVYGD